MVTPAGLPLDPAASVREACPPSGGRQASRYQRMGKKLYVGNLPFSSTEEELRELFGRFGSVDSVSVITDRDTGRPRGFAFVEMSEPSAAAEAIKALDGTQLGGRSIKVNEAQEKQRSGGGGGGRGGFGRSPRY